MPSGPVTVTACGPCGDPSGQRSAVSRWPPTACPLDPLELYGLWVPTCGLLPPPSAHCRLLPQVCTRGSRTCVCTPDTPSSGLHCKGPVASGREGGPARGSGQAPADRTLPPAHVPAVPGTCWIMPGPGSPGPHLEPARPRPPTPPPRRGRPFKATSQGCGRPGGLELRGLGRFWSAHGHWVCSSMGPRART